MSSFTHKAIFLLAKLGILAFITRAREIQTSLTAPAFSAVTPTPAMVNAALDQLAQMQAQCSLKNYQHVGSRNVLRKQIETMLKGQIAAVNGIAQGDLSVLELSGFDINQPPVPSNIPDQGVIKSITNLDESTVLLEGKGLRAKVYEAEIKGPNGFVKLQISTRAKMKISDLPAGVRLSAVMRGTNGKGVGLWSMPVKFVVSINPDEETTAQ